ncbi:hypothetical protein BU14_0220s0003 [Porphyra umbilicalis]|uniref:Uncharacterized protein n=1 Tax=Porphyra umbilicalis TaxID=2786 RepID=A0A1X6P4G4_PORUM|nr:hypothetical protein BU14_0220s0003 [Porphyra umbilicalis]|eukprot:OSX75771.1 hypothetical protein BU14_0220s0003 [Porphyra umbilicalis]
MTAFQAPAAAAAGRPRPALELPTVTAAELENAIERVDTARIGGGGPLDADDDGLIRRVDTSPAGGAVDRGAAGARAGTFSRAAARAGSDDYADAIVRVDTSPGVGATGGSSPRRAAAAAAGGGGASTDVDPTAAALTRVDLGGGSRGDAATAAGGGCKDQEDDAAAAVGATTAPTAAAGAAGSFPAAAFWRPPRPSKAQADRMREGMRVARERSAASADGANDGRVVMPTPEVVVDADPTAAVGVVDTPGLGSSVGGGGGGGGNGGRGGSVTHSGRLPSSLVWGGRGGAPEGWGNGVARTADGGEGGVRWRVD